MIDLAVLPVFLLAVLLLAIAPGPDSLQILGRGLGQGRQGALAAVLGGGVGRMLHMLAAVIGLSTLIASSALAFTILKYLGAAYLISLGVRHLLSPTSPLDVKLSPVSSLRGVFGQGVLTSMLNPKTALFYVSFLPQFVSPDLGAVPLQIVIFALLHNLVATSWNTVVALFSGTVGSVLARRPRLARGQKSLTGGVFVALGVGAALEGRPSR